MKKVKIAVVNQKGGSSKTTTSLLLTLAMASSGKKVLLIDTDPQGGSTAFIELDKTEGTLFEAVVETHDVEDCIYQVERGGLNFHFMPATHKLDKVSTTISPFIFSELLEPLEKKFDVIIFDTPPTLQGITRSAIIYANRIVTPAMISKGDLPPTLYTIDQIKELKKKPEIILIGYKKPKEGRGGYNALTTNQFYKAVKPYVLGSIEKKTGVVSAITNKDIKWTKSKIEKILKPIYELL